MAGTYRLKRRAERQEETRRRIVEAAVELHTTLGPLRTTDAAIAARAGVSRVTLYRHFPDDRSLFRACTLHGLVRWPPPDPRRWRHISDPAERLRTALVELYAYYRVAGPGMLVIGRDLPSMPQALKPSPNRMEALQAMGPFLLEGRPNRGRRRELLGIAIDHALAVSTWDSLVRRGGLTDDEAVRLLCAMVDAAAAPRPRARNGTPRNRRMPGR